MLLLTDNGETWSEERWSWKEEKKQLRRGGGMPSAAFVAYFSACSLLFLFQEKGPAQQKIKSYFKKVFVSLRMKIKNRPKNTPVARIIEGNNFNFLNLEGFLHGHIPRVTTTGHCFIDWHLNQIVSPLDQKQHFG